MTLHLASITGAGGGLGRALSAHPAHAGWPLALVTRSAKRLGDVGPAAGSVHDWRLQHTGPAYAVRASFDRAVPLSRIE